MVLIVAMAIVGTYAYLTSTDTVTNTFTVGKVKLTLDDENYKISKDDTVIIPAGRPRVPQIICENPDVEVYQASSMPRHSTCA